MIRIRNTIKLLSPQIALKQLSTQNMSTKRVIVLNKVPSSGVSYMKEQGLTVDYNDSSEIVSRKELLKQVKGYDGIYCLSYHAIDQELLNCAGEQLKVVGTMSVGFDHIDVEECKKRGIKVSHTPDVVTNSTAEYCVSLLLATSRRICEAAEAMKQGAPGSGGPCYMMGQTVKDSTVGIVGMGRIGRIVAQVIKSLGASRILYTNRSSTLPPEYQHLGAEKVPLDELLTNSDFVISLCVLNDETKRMFDKKAFEKMKKSAVFVNCGRGGLVNQDDLLWAIENKVIGAAGLDVSTPCPLPPDHPLLKHTNVVITPHIASSVEQTQQKMSLLVGKNIVAALNKQPMPTPLY